MGSTYVVCSTTSQPASDSLDAFEVWLGRTFTGVQIMERGNTGSRALVWLRGDHESPMWLDGWISEDRTAIYLEGDLGLVCETAMAAREVFPSDTDVVMAADWQGIPFDLRALPDAAKLAEAVERGDEAFAWRDTGRPG
jgi:hypothetical protein